ncbi:type VI secretion system Vgr family protein [Chitinophaga sancti]|uniref:Phage baseplate assembly protein V n=1 Tax=Chitinophaga sancti TaxID=1004 RepID=A0A1K1SGV7_9BACT|nr:phage baseplate assembly protein V [Chitinophaga sancti]WQD59860.1 phage baseplate assembly protein V [Chitinophaga sancti]WQG88009.1 phage baseplate assembly protein V [Chitinophaga sancti]SFW83311.1 Rhs element Vgr protein [Chitinophaga sancti]
MSQLTETIFRIDEKPVTLFSSFTLTQHIFSHHTFTLVCPSEAIDGQAGLLTKSKDLIGATFEAHISAISTDDSETSPLLFRGVITDVESIRLTGKTEEVMLTGYSPTIILDSGPHCKSWKKKDLKAILNDVIAAFPADQLAPDINPVYADIPGYTVQYKESAWEFLQRMAASYGEWLYWNGSNLVIGPPKDKNKTSLIYGSNLSQFAISLKAISSQHKYVTWDYQSSQVYVSSPDGVEQRAGLNQLGQTVYTSSNKLYSTQPKQWNYRFANNKSQQDKLVTLRSALEASRMVQFTGFSGNPQVSLGDTVDISGNNLYGGGETEGYGQYRITSINHRVNGKGNYDNNFTAIPASVILPPVEVPAEPVCETQSAIVTDNHDPLGLGRIQVRFHWMKETEKSPWIRVTTPHAGGGKGQFFIPETGEETIIGFEGDVATKPFVIGAVYHRSAGNTYSNAGNDIKALQSRSGNKLILNDKEGSVHLADKGGADMKFDGAGNATTNASKNSTLNAGTNNLINAGSTNVINVGATKDAPPTSVISMDADGTIILDGKTKILIQVGENKIEISKEGIFTTASDGKIHTIAKTGDVNIESETGEAKFKGSVKTNLGGGTNTFVIGSDSVEINQA